MTIELSQTINGLPIGFETGPRGVDPERPTLILIHGSGGSRLSWRLQLPALDHDINVVALELPGHGGTPGPFLTSVVDCAAWVARVLAAWNLPQAPVLAGHSLGGAVAIEAGLTRPELLGGLILVGTGAHLPVNPALIDGLTQNFEATIPVIMKWAFAKTVDPKLLEDAVQLMLQLDPALLINDFQACDRFDRRADLGRMALPTLIVCGRQEKMTPPALSEELQANIRGSLLEIIDNAGHEVMEEQPETFNQVVCDFVKSL